jgi:glucosylceramidase
MKNLVVNYLLLLFLTSCSVDESADLGIQVFETSAAGNKLQSIEALSASEKSDVIIMVNPDEKFQTITGFGGSFTESSAYLLNQLGAENRDTIIQAYFGEEGARYSLTRTHINSCDFSLSNYSYAPVEGDVELEHFSIEEDRGDIIPMIKDAQLASKEGFKIIASPWTAPPWMKDNNQYVGGRLLSKYYQTWSDFFVKYIEAYQQEGIDIWAVTVENEPLGNGNNWESMYFSPQEMTQFVQENLGPTFEKNEVKAKIFGYDQNRGEELIKWANVMYGSEESSKYFDGMAIHWYASTYDYFPASLNHTHEKAPSKHLINSEACVDADVPKWQDDQWYWSKEATDWGWTWAPDDQKYLHPKYVPVYRYARNIIGSLNNWVDGWVDWNMVLDRQGGPNWFKNWCVAPVIVDPDADEVYFTPLYYTLSHFSRYIRPGAVRIGFTNSDEDLMSTAVQNPDGSIVILLLNMGENSRVVSIQLGEESAKVNIDQQAIQTIVIPAKL